MHNPTASRGQIHRVGRQSAQKCGFYVGARLPIGVLIVEDHNRPGRLLDVNLEFSAIKAKHDAPSFCLDPNPGSRTFAASTTSLQVLEVGGRAATEFEIKVLAPCV